MGAYVPGCGFKAYWDSIEEAAGKAKILHEAGGRYFPYEIVSVNMNVKDFLGLPVAIETVLVINED